MAHPELLIVLPTLGERLDFLKTALDSARVVGETVPSTLVVVIPSSATAARALCAEYGAIIVDDPGTGMADAVNRGLEAATTEEFYVWVGDDDRLVAAGVEALVNELRVHDRVVVAYGQCEYITTDGTRVAISRAGSLARFLLPWGPNFIPHPGTIIRLDALKDIGGFDPRLNYALDLDVFLRLRTRGLFLSKSVLSAQFRWHPESLTVADRRASSRQAMAVKRRYLPPAVRWMSGLWLWPVAWLSSLAADAVTRRSRRVTRP